MVRGVYEGQCTAGVIVSLWVYSTGGEQAGACNNAVACNATRRFVLLITRMYHMD